MPEETGAIVGDNVNDRISIDPLVCSGKPCIRGTRIMVRNTLGMMAGGHTMEKVLQAYPELTQDDVSAAMEFAIQVMDEDRFTPRAS